VLSGSVLLVTYAGPHSGRSFTIPVLYARHGEALVTLAVAPERKRWWRAFRAGAAARLTVAGAALDVRGRLLSGAEAHAALAVYLDRFPRAASRLGVGPAPTAPELDEAARQVALVAFEPPPP
jgi:hypothetical protein